DLVVPDCPTRRSSDLDASDMERMSGGPPQGVCHLSRPGAPRKVVSSRSSSASSRNGRALEPPTHTVCSVGSTQLRVTFGVSVTRSEEHTSELQSRENL